MNNYYPLLIVILTVFTITISDTYGTGYEESENTKLARDRLNEHDQTFGGPGPALFDTPEFSYGFVGLVVVIGIISLIFLFKKKPN
jgi:hypothetical protein